MVSALALLPQDAPDPPVARLEVGGRPTVISRSDVARDVAIRYRRSEGGEQAVKLLVDRHLVETEARAKELWPSDADRERWTDRIRREVERAGQTLEALLASKRMTWDEFQRNEVALVAAHESLVREALELGAKDPVSIELQQLWLSEARGRHRIVTDPEELPPGIVATVDDARYDLADLGRVLLPNLDDEDYDGFVRRLALRMLVEHEAETLGVEVTEADTRAEIERRKQRVAADPRFRGASYEQWLLQTQGMTVDELARSDQMIATVRQRAIVSARYPDEAVDRMLEEDRDAILDRHGERRKVSMILLRATDNDNPLIPRTFAEAKERAAEIRADIAEGMAFANAARVHSEDPYSKVRGGEIGAFTRADDRAPEAVRAAAFGLPAGGVSEPVTVDQGVVLVRVDEVIPAPPPAVLRQRLRDELSQRVLRDLLEASNLEILD